MAKRIPKETVVTALRLYENEEPVSNILKLAPMDSRTLYRYIHQAKLPLRRPWFCNHHPKNPRAKEKRQ